MSTAHELSQHSAPLGGEIHPNAPAALDSSANNFNEDGFHVNEKPEKNSDDFSDTKDTKEGKAYVVEESTELDEEEITDSYTPFNDLPDEKKWICTPRALFVGFCCGALVNASNTYLGLKTGWTFSANFLGSIIGFGLLKPLGKAFPNAPIIGGAFGPRENNIVQTAATAAGGLGVIFAGGLPAMYRLNLMSEHPQDDFGRIVSLTIVGAYFGFAFSTPLRKLFIIYLARELKLVFPTPTATALTIRSMHLAATGEAVAKIKMKALSISFSVALVLRVVSQYALGILWDWHIFTWFYLWSKSSNSALAAENWGWFIEFTPAFIGAGMLVGLNTSISFFGGSLLAWGIIGPAIVHQELAFGIPANATTTPEKWLPLITFFSMSGSAATKETPSPRYWMLWPGVLTMMVVSFVELGLQWKIFYLVGKASVRAIKTSLGRPVEPQAEHLLVKDSASPEEQVKWYYWASLLAATIVAICVVLGVQYDMPVGMGILTVILAFFFSFLAVQCSGVTDIAPVSTAAKASQVVLGGATTGMHWGTQHAQTLNLLGGSVAGFGASQASDLTGDFRVGFLLRTPPDQQWYAQGLGSIVAAFMAPSLFILFTKAYPCILTGLDPHCPFSAPSVAAWVAVARAITDPVFPVPTSSAIFSLVFAIFAGAATIFRHYFYRGKFEKYAVWHPNFMVIGLSWTIPSTIYGTAMLMGSVPVYFWAKKYPKNFDVYGYAIAAGLIAGEGIGGVINALFQIVGISGPDPYGSNIACPGDAC